MNSRGLSLLGTAPHRVALALGCTALTLLACGTEPGSDVDVPAISTGAVSPLKGDGHIFPCEAGRFLKGGKCQLCSVCPAGKYKSGNCTLLSDTTCAACGTCAPDQFVAVACGPSSNSQCGACASNCAHCSGPGAGECTTCASGMFLAAGQCKTCHACPAGSAEFAPCNAVADAVCVPCAPGSFAAGTQCAKCPVGTWSPALSTSCQECGSCSDGDACTLDRCDEGLGCVHLAIPGCQHAAVAVEDAGAGSVAVAPMTPEDDAGTPAYEGGIVTTLPGPPDVSGACAVVGPGVPRRGVGPAHAALAMGIVMALLRERRRPRRCRASTSPPHAPARHG